MHSLLDAVATGRIKAAAINWPRQVRLMNNDDLRVRDHARRVLTTPDTGDRQQVVERYKAALEAGGDAVHGEKIFDRACRQCHQIQGKGVNFGPDLASIRNREPQFILADILHPNRSIADAYEFWSVTLKNGSAVSGLIASETSTSVTLKDLAGQTRTIPRSDIVSLQSSDVSVMPEGLENSVNVEQMRDLLAFLKKH
jgi:putative heme-binding domain-containing protein